LCFFFLLFLGGGGAAAERVCVLESKGSGGAERSSPLYKVGDGIRVL